MSVHPVSATSQLTQLREEIARIEGAQAMMASINAALQRGDVYALQRQNLSPQHISDLLLRHRRGLPAYPDYLFCHNEEYLDVLRSQLAELTVERDPTPMAVNY
ncbi:hypothetical protein [Bordetella pseudohinzii]|uniref:Uncharacterized protein n=1 Tax=Bordetella pseudohinzii TaxID=1331258 RepID=A0A0J6BZC5_9BORD|nr:hypothetical protein [Bordetella pseudohinzii]ANY18472.1 hypothetical protein BBN53_20825 [Bordetella pseudohinzii]KMM24068.1 hypothetical protein L540_08020 [Bordetella pseudohinzii]KXA77869.1 hypothetical protein AW878_14335 [Bordetella pseudohinzii]KXA78064.1 hypothetical protein AW877_12790 [Bordetella pseudohinzii]CUJ13381.1 Uncharacterised protein [Bordetella pseudohinzii]